MDKKIDDRQDDRYSRQIILEDIGVEGQKKLGESRILCIGAGGLGSPSLVYLAAAGVGKIGIIDPDEVELSNLHRQIIHSSSRIGHKKVDSAAAFLNNLNPHIHVETYREAFTTENAMRLVSSYDLVIDGSDNFPTRYLVNDACVLAGVPFISGSVFHFSGRIILFSPAEPCYRCLFPEAPEAGEIPSCAEAGVLGVVPGLAGILQATEAIKWILKLGKPLLGRLLTFDLRDMAFCETKLDADPGCPLCGDNKTITQPGGYGPMEAFERACASPSSRDDLEISAEDVHTWREEGKVHTLLDVREPHEYEQAKISGSVLIPLGELRKRHHEIDQKIPVVVYCHRGYRSLEAAATLKAQGFEVRSLRYGIAYWSQAIDKTVPQY